MTASAAASRQPSVAFHIPAGSLGAAIAVVGGTAGVSIGVADQELAAIPIHAVDGRYTVARVLRVMLQGTRATFLETDPMTFAIVRRIVRSYVLSSSPGFAVAEDGGQILVTGSKRSAALRDYAGSVDVVDVTNLRSGQTMHGSDALVEQLPILSSTHLGPGRDKLFIRGIADSSFTGPTQSTVGQYLGDVRLNYNAPDPNLALYDIRSVEVLEGPQGTLYGAGSLGGIIRLEPEPPNLADWSLSISAGGSLSAHGSPGTDGAAIANLPLNRGRMALRIVAYGGIDGGYIDDPSRGLWDINRTVTRGVRATLRWQPKGDWTVDVGGVVQNINSSDGQYADRGSRLNRSSILDQPFDNDYGLASLVIRHATDRLSLVSATSYVSHEIDTVFDASTSASTPRQYESEDAISIWTNETRLSHREGSGFSWVVGTELMRSEDRLTRSLGPPAAPVAIAGSRNIVEQVSAFGEATLPLWSRWSVAAGARLGYSRQIGRILDQPEHHDSPNRHDIAALPSLAIVWRPAAGISAYAKYQEGYRPGGLSVQANQAQRFEADSVAAWEVGVRWKAPVDRFSASIAASYAHWEDIQADLVDGSGLPYTANIGSGHVAGLEARIRWNVIAGVKFDASFFVDQSRLASPAPPFVGERDATLPNVPSFLGRGAMTYRWRVAGHDVEASGSARYVGRSRLGVGPLLDLRQGGYLETSAGLKVSFTRFALTFDGSNLLDTRGNLFSLGNPFGVTAGRQITPLRPRTIRLGFAAQL